MSSSNFGQYNDNVDAGTLWKNRAWGLVNRINSSENLSIRLEIHNTEKFVYEIIEKDPLSGISKNESELSKKFKKLKQEHIDLLKENSQQKTEIIQQQTKIAKLLEDILQQEKTIENLQSQLDTQKKTNEQAIKTKIGNKKLKIKQKNEFIQTDLPIEKSTNKKISDDNEKKKYEEELSKLNDEIRRLKEENNKLYQDNNSLKEENEKFGKYKQTEIDMRSTYQRLFKPNNQPQHTYYEPYRDNLASRIGKRGAYLYGKKAFEGGRNGIFGGNENISKGANNINYPPIKSTNKKKPINTKTITGKKLKLKS